MNYVDCGGDVNMVNSPMKYAIWVGENCELLFYRYNTITQKCNLRTIRILHKNLLITDILDYQSISTNDYYKIYNDIPKGIINFIIKELIKLNKIKQLDEKFIKEFTKNYLLPLFDQLKIYPT